VAFRVAGFDMLGAGRRFDRAAFQRKGAEGTKTRSGIGLGPSLRGDGSAN
jgi:hypothetical protein